MTVKRNKNAKMKKIAAKKNKYQKTKCLYANIGTQGIVAKNPYLPTL